MQRKVFANMIDAHRISVYINSMKKVKRLCIILKQDGNLLFK